MAETVQGAPEGGNVTEKTFLSHLESLRQSKDAVEKAKGRYKAARKAAKADGISLKELDDAVSLASEDHDEVRSRYATTVQYLKWLRSPIGTQLDAFAGLADLTIAEKAHGDGFAASLRGEPTESCPHAPGTSQREDWLRGWNDHRNALGNAGAQVAAVH